MSPRALAVLDAGPLTTVQDAGRPGHAHLGVPPSGWLDERAASLANRLVGNLTGRGTRHAVLENLGGGLRLRAVAALTVAVTGAPVALVVDGRPVGWGEPVSVPEGAVLTLGRVLAGARCYLAVAGGIVVPPVLGSRATDTLSGLGPPVVAPGAALPVGDPVGSPRPVDGLVPAADGGAGELGTGVVLPCTPGPRVDWFAAGALDRLASSSYVVTGDADRVGIRLDGPALARIRTEELPSEGLVRGAVQVPADGRPLVFLNDHPTTGGYPVLAVVDAASVRRCAQLRPGDAVRFALA